MRHLSAVFLRYCFSFVGPYPFPFASQFSGEKETKKVRNSNECDVLQFFANRFSHFTVILYPRYSKRTLWVTFI